MRYTFNGSIVPYYHRCPKSFKLRNIDRKFLPKQLEEPEEPYRLESPREKGIRLHSLLNDYFRGEVSEIPDEIDTPLISMIMDRKEHCEVFKTEYELATDMSFNPLGAGDQAKDIVTARLDLFTIEDGVLNIYDWKFGTSEKGLSLYWSELNFFAALAHAHYPEIEELHKTIHFPLDDYTVPMPPTSGSSFFVNQVVQMNQLKVIKQDHNYFPRPSFSRCRFCDYRPEEAGGMGICKEALLP